MIYYKYIISRGNPLQSIMVMLYKIITLCCDYMYSQGHVILEVTPEHEHDMFALFAFLL